jgi:hypothetical protein
MALVFKDRVKETTSVSGVSDAALNGAVDTYVTFSSVMSDGDTAYYAIITLSSGVDEWETGLGTYVSATNTLQRTTILNSSNSNNKVNFSSGNKDIFITLPADKIVIDTDVIALATALGG